MEKEVKSINLTEKFDLFHAHWTPHIIGELNGQFVKLAKVSGDFVWHDHKEEDELFLVIKGTLFIALENQPTVQLNPGEMAIIPKGLAHKPYTEAGEAHILLFEPKRTLHTGEVENELTVKKLNWI